MSAKPKIVHESEVQRQHVRLPFPAKAEINKKSYNIKDLSSGGVAIQNVEGDFQAGQMISLSLKLPFGTFSLDVHLDAEIQHYNVQEKLLGCRFVNLTTDQISLLNHALKAFMAGDAVASGDLLNVTSRENFVKARKSASGDAAMAPGFDVKRQLPGLAIAVALGLFGFFVIGSNVYASMFTLKASDAVVSSPTVELKASAYGYFKNELSPDTLTVQPGQVMGALRSTTEVAMGLEQQPFVPLKSPCDCVIVKTHVNDGTWVTAGTQIASLVPSDAEPWITAAIPANEASRITPNDKVKVTIAGVKAEYTGRIENMESSLASGNPAALASGAGYAPGPVLVKIALDQKVPVDMTGRPAYVLFAAR